MESERVIKIDARFMYIGLPTADPTWAEGIQLLLNPKLLYGANLSCSKGREAQFMYVMSMVNSWSLLHMNFDMVASITS